MRLNKMSSTEIAAAAVYAGTGKAVRAKTPAFAAAAFAGPVSLLTPAPKRLRMPYASGEGIVFTCDDPSAESVFIAGSFNGWNTMSHRLSRGADGLWRITIPLAEGTYQYKFIVDGRWTLDPANPYSVSDGAGHVNSIVAVGPNGKVRARVTGFSHGYFHQFDAVKSSDWVKDSVIYEIFVREFTPEGTFQALKKRIPYIKDLGVDCVWLMPIHPIGERDRKGSLGSPYAIKDYYEVHPALGTKEDFKELVKEFHRAGIKVIIDLVANHTSNDCPLIKEHPDWYVRDSHGHIMHPEPDWTDISQLNYENPGLRRYMKEMIKYWVREFDIDGYRCDVAPKVPVDFWREVRHELREIKPDVMLLAESHEPVHNAEAFDLTYDGELPFALERTIKWKAPAATVLDSYERQAAEFPKGALRLRFLENHDQERAMVRIGRRGYVPAAVMLMTMHGVPLIQNGQEIGETEPCSLFDRHKIDWRGGDARTLGLYKHLIRLRKELVALRRGTMTTLETSDDVSAAAFARVYEDQVVVVVANLSDEALDLEVNLPAEALGIKAGMGYRIGEALWSGETAQAVGEELDSLEFDLEPFGARVFVIERAK